jgi:hypothetical protein
MIAWFSASGHHPERRDLSRTLSLNFNHTQVFSGPLNRYKPIADWSCIYLIVVDETRENTTYRMILSDKSYSSFLYFTSTLERAANFETGTLNGRVKLVHVSMDGRLVLKQLDSHYIDSWAFEYDIIIVDCWQTSHEYIVCLKACIDG